MGKGRSLRIFQQNTGLIPVPHRGWMPRKAVVRRLIEHLRQEDWDVVGLTEVFRHSERDMIVEALADRLPHVVYGPEATNFPPRFSGGGLLLSRYPLSEHRSYVCRNSTGVDALCNKGLIMARIHPEHLPGPICIALSHTQNPDANGLESNRDVTRKQLEELGNFLASELDPAECVLLMGDLNTDAYERTKTMPPQTKGTYVHLRMQFPGFQDLWRTRGDSKSAGITFDDHSTFRTGVPLSFEADERDRRGQRLDYFLARRARAWKPLWSKVKVRILGFDKDLEISDHYGLEIAILDHEDAEKQTGKSRPEDSDSQAERIG